MYPEFIQRKEDSPSPKVKKPPGAGRPRKVAQAPLSSNSKKRKQPSRTTRPRGSVAAVMLDEPDEDPIPADEDSDPNGEAVSVVRHPDGFSPRLRSSQPAPLPASFLPGATVP